jgi:hypothetical protein
LDRQTSAKDQTSTKALARKKKTSAASDARPEKNGVVSQDSREPEFRRERSGALQNNETSWVRHSGQTLGCEVRGNKQEPG